MKKDRPSRTAASAKNSATHKDSPKTAPGKLGFFFKMSLPYTHWMLLGLFLVATTLVMGVGLAGVSGWFLTATAIAGLSLPAAQAFNIFLPSAGIRFFAIGRTASRWLERVVSHDATFRIIGRLRVWLYGKLSGLSPRQLGGLHAGDVLNRLTRDIDLLDNLYLRLLLPTIASILVLSALAGFVGGIAAILVWPLVAVIVVAVIIVPLIAYRSGLVLSRDLVADQNRLRVAILDSVDGIEELALHRPSWNKVRDTIALIDDERQSKQLRFQRRGAILRAALILLSGAGAWVLIWLVATVPGADAATFGVALPSDGRLLVDGATLVALVMLLMGTVEIIQGLPRAWLELAGTMAAAGRVSGIAGQEPSPAFAVADRTAPIETRHSNRTRGPETITNSPSAFEVRVAGLSFAYDAENPVLSDINLVVPEGAHLAVLGPSGGGKSTLAAILSRAEEYSAGHISLGGKDLRDYAETDFRDLVAASTQEPWIFTASIARNLRIAKPDASDAELFGLLDLVGLGDKVRDWPEGLETWIEEGGASLSGGERRRLAAARVLLRDCPITILDEATEGLDDVAADALVAAVRSHRAGKTLIWISHRPHGIGAFDRVIAVENGSVVEVR